MIVQGDCLKALRELEDESVDAVITDPPYGIGFMGHEWDQPGVQMPAQREGVPSGERRKSQPAASGFDLESDAAVAGRYDHSRSAMHAFQWWCEQWARECLRVLKPGGHIAAFGGARTSHRLACAIEDAGFEIRDSIVWLFGQGFPKSLNVGKAIDKELGGEGSWRREDHPGRPGKRLRNAAIIGQVNHSTTEANPEGLRHIYEPETDEGKAWDGWGTALKPAHEPVVVGRKPLSEGGVAANVLKHRTGAINVAAARIDVPDRSSYERNHSGDRGHDGTRPMNGGERSTDLRTGGGSAAPGGRWPANVVLTHTEDCELLGTKRVRAATGTMGQGGYGTGVTYGTGKGLRAADESGPPVGYGDEDGLETVEAWACAPGCPVAALDGQTGVLQSGTGAVKRATAAGWQSGSMAGRESRPEGTPNVEYGDAGGASRFFYCGKASRLERNAGLDGFEEKEILWSSGEQSPGTFQSEGTERRQKNHHSTVKPIDLMRWLVRLFVAPGGVVVDPFVGSGTTGCACALEGVQFIGIEREVEYVRIAEARVRYWASKPVGMETERILRAELARPERSGQLSMM